MDLEQQKRCFGTELSVLRSAYEHETRRRRPTEVAISMLSDAQEMLERAACEPTRKEQLRQHLNRVKWLIGTYCETPGVTP